jgi:hypothetical protein
LKLLEPSVDCVVAGPLSALSLAHVVASLSTSGPSQVSFQRPPPPFILFFYYYYFDLAESLVDQRPTLLSGHRLCHLIIGRGKRKDNYPRHPLEKGRQTLKCVFITTVDGDDDGPFCLFWLILSPFCPDTFLFYF